VASGKISFRLAPMSGVIRALTVGLLLLPIAFLVSGALWNSVLFVPGLLLAALYGWVWLRHRPQGFVIEPAVLEVIWPLRRRQIERRRIVEARLVDGCDLKRELGWAVRVGVGGLWGGFGWLWTQRRGIVQMYISRTDQLVWLECLNGRPWLISPEQPERFVRALSR
jgi:hypothetical protein